MKKKILSGVFGVLLGYLLLVALYFSYLELGGTSNRREYEMENRKEYEMKRKELVLSLPAVADSEVRNYATVSFAALQGQTTIEQKYEKVASLDSVTTQFEEAQKQAREVIKTHNCLIQEEETYHNDGVNVLRLTIGVPPGEFDAAVVDLRKIGTIDNFQVTKTDKTNAFLELKAKRATLEKTRDALIALKSQGGKIEELVKLEQEILSLEGKIQELGVQLGQFDKVNEFCTVRFNLREKERIEPQTNHLGNLVASFEWAGTTYLAILAIGFVGLLGVVLVLLIAEKMKLLRVES